MSLTNSDSSFFEIKSMRGNAITNNYIKNEKSGYWEFNPRLVDELQAAKDKLEGNVKIQDSEYESDLEKLEEKLHFAASYSLEKTKQSTWEMNKDRSRIMQRMDQKNNTMRLH